MKLNLLVAGLSCALLTACGSAGITIVKTDVDVEIINKSSRDLENAVAQFGNYDCKWGIVGRTSTAGYGFYPHPITARTELHWDEDGKHRVEKIDLSKIYPVGISGRLTFTVYDGRVEVAFREIPNEDLR